MADKFIQKAHIKKGRVRNYLQHKYGSDAFKSNNDIKVTYINKAIKSTDDTSLKRALRLAKTLKKIHKK